MNPSVTKPAAPEPDIEKIMALVDDYTDHFVECCQHTAPTMADYVVLKAKKNAIRAALKPAVPEPDSVHQVASAINFVSPSFPSSGAANYASPWIAVSERLPKPGICVLICEPSGVSVGSRDTDDEDSRKWLDLLYQDMGGDPVDTYKVTHWMELPLPPLAASGSVPRLAEADEQQSAVVPAPVEPTAERMEDALHKIKVWSEAYPVEVFHIPTSDEWKRLHEAAQAAGLHGIDAFSAANMRHVITQVQAIVDSALNPKRPVEGKS